MCQITTLSKATADTVQVRLVVVEDQVEELRKKLVELLGELAESRFVVSDDYQ